MTEFKSKLQIATVLLLSVCSAPASAVSVAEPQAHTRLLHRFSDSGTAGLAHHGSDAWLSHSSRKLTELSLGAYGVDCPRVPTTSSGSESRDYYVANFGLSSPDFDVRPQSDFRGGDAMCDDDERIYDFTGQVLFAGPFPAFPDSTEDLCIPMPLSPEGGSCCSLYAWFMNPQGEFEDDCALQQPLGASGQYFFRSSFPGRSDRGASYYVYFDVECSACGPHPAFPPGTSDFSFSGYYWIIPNGGQIGSWQQHRAWKGGEDRRTVQFDIVIGPES